MAILDTFIKQPADVQDYDIVFQDYLNALSDTGLSVSVYADAGLVILAAVLNNGIVKVWTSGGTDKTTYKITATLVTTGGRTNQQEIRVKVKEF